MENTQFIMVRVSPELRARVQQAAKASDRSTNAEIRRLLNSTYTAPTSVQR
jgi:predicted HicB family RNase H-like nuclease